MNSLRFRPNKEQLRRWLPGFVAITGLAGTIWAIIWIHSAARTSPDAWASSIAAGTTAALALITLWYAYLTFKLLDAQRSAPRTAAWEDALRDLSLYMAQKRRVIWDAAECFPAGKQDDMPPGVLELFRRRDAVAELYDHLLDVMGFFPKRFQVQILGVIIHLVETHSEIHSLAAAVTEAQQLGREHGQHSWSWKDVQQAHEAAKDPERSQPWVDIIEGRQFHTAQAEWEQLSADVDKYLRT